MAVITGGECYQFRKYLNPETTKVTREMILLTKITEMKNKYCICYKNKLKTVLVFTYNRQMDNLEQYIVKLLPHLGTQTRLLSVLQCLEIQPLCDLLFVRPASLLTLL